MTLFRVWAPRAHEVKLDLPSGQLEMDPGEHGWYSLDLDLNGMDLTYAFSLDGGEPRPDPRSLFQPHGPLGPSRTYDHSRFQWTDQHFAAKALSSAVFYEIHIGTFTPRGTFESAIERLDYLVDLGVTHVQLMPICEFPGARGWGYDGVDLFAPHHAYGGPNGLKRLINACHERGLAAVLDVVYNHLGPTGNFLDEFGPYFMHEHPGRWGKPFNFGEAFCQEVRQFFVENMKLWLRDYHFDGLRLDAIHVMIDFSAYNILEELVEECKELEAHVGRPLVLIAESDSNDPRSVLPREAHGIGLDAQWLDDFHHAVHALMTGQTTGYFTGYGEPVALATTLQKGFYFAGTYCAHRDRCHGRSSEGISAHKFVGFIQNHDQIGNRYLGERSCQLMSKGRSKIAAAVVLTAPFMPLLFMGEEWAASTPFLYFTDHEDPELARAVSIGRKKDFSKIGWDENAAADPQDPQTMELSTLKWDEIHEGEHGEMLEFYKHLIRLRRKYPDITDGRMSRIQVQYDEEARWVMYWRGAITTAFNYAAEPRTIPLHFGLAREVLAASDENIRVEENRIELPPDSVVLLGPS